MSAGGVGSIILAKTHTAEHTRSIPLRQNRKSDEPQPQARPPLRGQGRSPVSALPSEGSFRLQDHNPNPSPDVTLTAQASTLLLIAQRSLETCPMPEDSGRNPEGNRAPWARGMLLASGIGAKPCASPSGHTGSRGFNPTAGPPLGPKGQLSTLPSSRSHRSRSPHAKPRHFAGPKHVPNAKSEEGGDWV